VAYEKIVVINEVTYKLAALTARQMRDLASEREKNPNISAHEQNARSIADSINNYAKNHAEPSSWTADMALDLPWPVYKQLNKEVSEVSGFEDDQNPPTPQPEG
jgi:hypothetical protein